MARVVLLHGFNKDETDMEFMGSVLAAHGFEVFAPRMPTTFSGLDSSVAVLTEFIREHLGDKRFSIVAHSMGGLIARRYIHTHTQTHNNVDKCVFIGTPHAGTRLADIAVRLPLYPEIYKGITDLTSDIEFYDLSDSDLKLFAVIGSKNDGILGKLFLSSDSDGRVEVSSALPPDVEQYRILNYNHSEIHHQTETAELVCSFLQGGSLA